MPKLKKVTNDLNHLLMVTILFLANCDIATRNPLDSSQPLGAIYQLLPIFFPGLKPASSKALKTYFISESGSSGAIKGGNISLTVPYSTNLDSLTAELYHTGQDITVNSVRQVSGETKNNFNNPLVYSVKAANTTTLDYTLKTSKGSPTSNNLLAFSLGSNLQINSYSGIITGSIVTVYVPNGTDLTSLTAVFSHNGKKVQVGGIDQTSSKSKQSFSSPVVYSVYSEVGAKQDYSVSASVGGSDSKEIKAFWLDSLQATIVGTDILLGIGSDKNYKSLITDFVHTGSEVKISGKSIVSGENSFDYSNPVIVTVVAKNGSSKDYKVIVSSVNAFSIGGFVSGLGSGKNMILQNNGVDNTTLFANGNFSFNTTVPNYGAYNVTVLTYPTNQYCTVTNGAGAANGSVTSILVDCNNTTVPNFTDLGNQTIMDNNTGLVWMRCIMSDVSGVPRTGTWCVDTTIGNYPYCNSNTNDCNSGGTYGSFTGGSSTISNTAWKACNDANSNPVGGFGGRTNWRVPSPEIFFTIIDYYNGGAYSGKPYRTYFPMGSGAGLYNFYHWTSSNFVVGSTLAYAIWGTTGALETQNKNISAAVRCVSGP